MTEVPNALTRAMRVCEPKQEEGRNFIAIHITKVWQVQSNSNQVNPQQRKGNLPKPLVLVIAQSNHRIHFGSATGRQVTGQEDHEKNY
jgi:hypothetical protein